MRGDIDIFQEPIMSNFVPSPIYVLFIAGVATALTACASGGAAYRPIVDAPNTAGYAAKYEADLADCRSFAEQRRYDNSDVRTQALVGASIGGVLGLIEGDGTEFEDFAVGAAAGGAFGAGSGALETRGERKQIVVRCMQGRGHRVLG